MRVFYAVTFNDETKERLIKYKNLIESNSIKGRFTDKNNFHITLEFIGEIDKIKLKSLIDILYKLKQRPKYIVTSHIGSFERGNKEIAWVGIEENEQLIELQKELRSVLIDNGFDLDDRKYTPHITIGRQIVRNISMPMDKNNIEPIKVPIYSIALMESKRVDGKLIYEPIEEILL